MDENLMHRILIEVKAMVDEMHGVVYRNGLVRSIKDQSSEIANIKNELTEIKKQIYRSDAEILESCPYRKETEEQEMRIKSDRRDRFDKRLIIYGLIIGGISMIPQFVALFFR